MEILGYQSWALPCPSSPSGHVAVQPLRSEDILSLSDDHSLDPIQTGQKLESLLWAQHKDTRRESVSAHSRKRHNAHGTRLVGGCPGSGIEDVVQAPVRSEVLEIVTGRGQALAPEFSAESPCSLGIIEGVDSYKSRLSFLAAPSDGRHFGQIMAEPSDDRSKQQVPWLRIGARKKASTRVSFEGGDHVPTQVPGAIPQGAKMRNCKWVLILLALLVAQPVLGQDYDPDAVLASLEEVNARVFVTWA